MANNSDLQAHRDVWTGFLKLVWISATVTAGVLALMAIFLV
ncbi:MAG: aa3-type cytochrome c oxidase subunit IV [Pseudomonadota bacterium]